MALKVCIENNSGAYAQMFVSNGWEVVDHLGKADLLQLEGGADVHPNLYGEKKHPRTYSSENADERTIAFYAKALELDIPIAGICRGSQFLCVMGGGKLWQDVDGHANGMGHNLVDVGTGIIIEGCSSTHHQQHRPADNAIIIATASPQLCTVKANTLDGVPQEYPIGVGQGKGCGDISIVDDIEAFYYPHINSLGYQCHPEFFDKNHPCQKYYFDIISKYLKLRA